MNAIILHGMPDKEEYFDPNLPPPSQMHWLQWIKQELASRGINTETPDLPEPYAPVYESWKATLEKFPIDESTHLVGHSCGAGFLVRWLSENDVSVGRVVLVAPYLDPSREKTGPFFDFKIDSRLNERTKGIWVVYSIDDDKDILTSVETLRKTLPAAEFVEMKGKGHFTFDDMKTDEFPELIEILELGEISNSGN